jgi:hypothetical protein
MTEAARGEPIKGKAKRALTMLVRVITSTGRPCSEYPSVSLWK